ncbi:hypothetical protein [Prevotella sp. HUN102]|uniref:hypothetical protein n=1 Tax=Prevotella sp. HUN102 TaxID=1392486 RepID=UPI00048B14E1|nr:hypothetical protein [Prevotella sp. HUN102]
MKILKILEKGEQVSEKQMVDLCGGTDMMANTNKAVLSCSCDGNGDNTNKGFICSCDEVKPLKPTTGDGGDKPITRP